MSEESRRNPSRGSPETENTKIKMKDAKKYISIFHMNCRNGHRISKRIWWTSMFNRINTLQTLLMNCQWSREPKWYGARVSKASILTSRKTEIVTSAGGRKITKASCRRRAGTVVPRAENFSDVIAADHKILSEESESRNNHRYAVVVQDLATQWLQSYPCKTKTSHETQKSLMKFLEPTRQPKVIYTDNSKEFGKSCEELSWYHCTSTPHRSETNGTAERAVRRVKVLLQSGLDEKVVSGFHGMLLLSSKYSGSFV